jgi:hypothetical protein
MFRKPAFLAFFAIVVAVAPNVAMAGCNPFAPHTCIRNNTVRTALTPPEIRATQDTRNVINRNRNTIREIATPAEVRTTRDTRNVINRNRNTIREIATPPEVRTTRDTRNAINRNRNTIREIATPPEVRQNRDIFNANRRFAEGNRYNPRQGAQQVGPGQNGDLYNRYRSASQRSSQQIGIEQAQIEAQQQAQRSIALAETRDQSAVVAGGGRPVLGAGAGNVLPGVSGRSVTYIENGDVTVIGPQGDVQYGNGRALQ